MELWLFQGNRVVGMVGMVGMVGHEFWLAQDFFISNSSSLVKYDLFTRSACLSLLKLV